MLIPQAIFAITVTAAICAPPYAGAEPRLDHSKAFSYTLPEGWTVFEQPLGGHDFLVSKISGKKNRTIITVNQPGTEPLAEIKSSYERNLAKALPGFKLRSSEMITLKNGAPAARLIHTSIIGGAPNRQINYILEVAGKRYFIVCAAPEEEGDRHDKTFEAFIESMTAPK